MKLFDKTRTPAGNSRFAKARISCFYYSEIRDPSSVFLMKFSTENARLLVAAKR